MSGTSYQRHVVGFLTRNLLTRLSSMNSGCKTCTTPVIATSLVSLTHLPKVYTERPTQPVKLLDTDITCVQETNLWHTKHLWQYVAVEVVAVRVTVVAVGISLLWLFVGRFTKVMELIVLNLRNLNTQQKKATTFVLAIKVEKFGIQPERIGSNKLTIKQIKNTEDTVKYRSDATIPQKSTVERSNAFRLPTNTSAISTTTNTTATQSIKHQPELLLAHHRQNKIHQHTICKTKSKHVN